MTGREPQFAALYDAVTAQLEHEFDVLGYEGNTEGIESLERIRAAVVDVRMKWYEAVFKPWRMGRKVGRTIYAQVGDEPSEDDPLIGVMDSRVLAADVVASHNAVLMSRPRAANSHSEPSA